jgi:hypothetical protein
MLMMPATRKNEVRAVALARRDRPAAVGLGLSSISHARYEGYQFIEQYNWLPQLGITLHFGVDGMSAPLVLLTGIVMFTGVLISWGNDDPHVMSGIQDRPREFFAFLFLLAGGVFGVFVSLDLFMLFFFYEIAVFPMYLLIAIWGWVKTREYAAMKLTLYLFIGSVVALVGALAMYWTQYQNTGVLSFDMLQMESAGFSCIPKYLVPARLPRLCSVGRHLALPQLVTGWSRCSADCCLHVPCRCADETRRIRSPARWRDVAARRRETMGMAHYDLCCYRRGLWCLHRVCPNRPEIHDRFLVRVAHGLGGAGHFHTQSDGVGRRRCADVLARRDDGSLLCRHRHDLRPRAYPHDPRVGRHCQGDTNRRDRLSSSAVWFRWACPVSPVLLRNSPFSWACGKSNGWWRSSPAFPLSSPLRTL